MGSPRGATNMSSFGMSWGRLLILKREINLKLAGYQVFTRMR